MATPLTGHSTLDAFGAMVREEKSGLLMLRTDKLVRQLVFVQGNCTAVHSNAKSEMAGSFLLKKGRITQGQFESHFAQTRQTKTNHWALLTQLTNLTPADLKPLQTERAEQIAAILGKIPQAQIAFTAKIPDTPQEPILSGLRWLIAATSDLSSDHINKAYPELTSTSTVIPQPKLDQRVGDLSLDPEERGLLTVVLNSNTVDDVRTSSFLKPEKIERLLLAYQLAGFMELESPEMTAKKKHEASLSDQDRAIREEILGLASRIDSTSYYEWLGVDSRAPASEITNRGTQLLERYASPSIDPVFTSEEKPVREDLLTRLKEAYTSLANPSQRNEYDSYLSSGKTGSFLGQSHSIQFAQVLQKGTQLFQSGKVEEACAVFETSIQETDDPGPLLLGYSRLLLPTGVGKDPARQKFIFSEIQRALKVRPKNGPAMEATALWNEALGQKEKAFDAALKALTLTPTSKHLQDLLVRLNKKEGPATVVRALFSRLGELTHYDLLGISPEGNLNTIRASYRDLTKRFHPDRFFASAEANLKDQAKEVYKRIVEAHITLRDTNKRRYYDRELLAADPRPAGAKPTAASPTPSEPPQTQQGKKFYDLAMTAIRQGNRDAAKLNLEMALQSEPDNGTIKTRLAELQAQPPKR